MNVDDFFQIVNRASRLLAWATTVEDVVADLCTTFPISERMARFAIRIANLQAE